MTYQRRINLILCMLLLSAVSCTGERIPKHIKQIYKQYKQGLMDSLSNSVRYIEPVKESQNSTSGVLLYNMDAINQGEIITKAELHFFRRTSEEFKKIIIEAADVSPFHRFITQTMENKEHESTGWKTLNVTRSVQQCVNTVEVNYQLELTFLEEGKGVSMTRFLRHHGVPFLLIFSNDNTGIARDQIKGKAGDTKEDWLREMDKLNDFTNFYRGKRSLIEDGEMSALHRILSQMERQKQEHVNIETANIDDMVFTNEIDADGNAVMVKKTDNDQEDLFRTVPPLIIPSVPKDKDDNLSFKPVVTLPTINILPWPLKQNWKKNGARRAKESKNSGCGRKNLKVYWEDLGWKDRIIAPKRYDAYTCTGSCSYPFSKDLKPSNHAILLSLLQTIQQREDGTTPCCVPEHLSPLTVMFYDDFGNIVVKNYERMVVQSCSCR